MNERPPLRFMRRWWKKLLRENRSDSGRRLFVDISVIRHRDAGTGIQRVVRALLDQLTMQLPDGWTLQTIAASKHRGYRGVSDPTTPCPTSRAPLCIRSGDIFLGLDLAAHLLPRHERQIARWRRRGMTVHLIVYDLLPVQHPAWFNSTMVEKFAAWLGVLARNADGAICISNTVATDLKHWLTSKRISSNHPAISRISLGNDLQSSRPTSGLSEELNVIERLGKDAPIILMVGTIEPRKDYGKALDAFEYLWAHDHQDVLLVIVGRPGWRTEAVQRRLSQHIENGRRLFWLSDASDETLERLYHLCRGLLVTSLGEGYGLPLIEAGLHRRPVLARDLPIFREVAGNSVRYFQNDQPADLAGSIAAWLSDDDVPLLNPGDLSDWRQSAAELLNVLGIGSRSA